MTYSPLVRHGASALALGLCLAATPVTLDLSQAGNGFVGLSVSQAFAKDGRDDGGSRGDGGGRGGGDKSDDHGGGRGGSDDNGGDSGGSGSDDNGGSGSDDNGGSGSDDNGGDRGGGGSDDNGGDRGSDDNGGDRSDSDSDDRNDDSGGGGRSRSDDDGGDDGRSGRGGGDAEDKADSTESRGRGRGSDDGLARGVVGGSRSGSASGGLTVVKVEREGSGLEIVYSNGIKEEIESGRYELKNAAGRTMVERTATAADIARIEGNVKNSGISPTRNTVVTTRSAPRVPSGRAARIEVGARSVEVNYSTGWREQVELDRYELKDPNNNTVIERPATQGDIDRLMALAR